MTGTVTLSKCHEKQDISSCQNARNTYRYNITCDRTYFLLSAILSHQALFQVFRKYLALLATQNSVFEVQ